MLTGFIDLIADFALFIKDNGGTGDFTNFDLVFGAFGSMAEAAGL
jgi:hypothetical protein